MPGAPSKILRCAVILGIAWLAKAVPKSGDVTFYDPMKVMSKTGIGACGVKLDKSMKIAALAKEYFDRYPGAVAGNSNKNPLCGKKVRVTVNGKHVDVTILDRCDDCPQPFNIDLSESAFKQLSDPSVGRTKGTWDFVNPKDDVGMKLGQGSPGAPKKGPHRRDDTNYSVLQGRSSTPVAQRRSIEHIPRRTSRIAKNLVNDRREATGLGLEERAGIDRPGRPRPRRLSRIMRDIVAGHDN